MTRSRIIAPCTYSCQQCEGKIEYAPIRYPADNVHTACSLDPHRHRLRIPAFEAVRFRPRAGMRQIFSKEGLIDVRESVVVECRFIAI